MNGWGKHATAGWQARKDRVWDFVCEVCGDDFQAGSPNARWCGDRCRQAAEEEQWETERAERIACREAKRIRKNWEVLRYEVVCDPDTAAGFCPRARLSVYDLRCGLRDGYFTPGMRLLDRATGQVMTIVGGTFTPQAIAHG